MEMNKTPKKAPNIATKSNLSTFQMRYAALKLINEITAAMMTDARMVLGVYLNSGVRAFKTTITTSAITMFDTVVYAPALKFTADLEKEPGEFLPPEICRLIKIHPSQTAQIHFCAVSETASIMLIQRQS